MNAEAVAFPISGMAALARLWKLHMDIEICAKIWVRTSAVPARL